MKGFPRAVAIAVYELAAILREAVMIPARLWMRAAEAAGRLTLAAWRIVEPRVVAALRLLLAGVRIAERRVTAARAVAAVAVAAGALLVASQFVDYRAVQIGAPEYAAVREIASPPEREQRTPTDEHGILLVLLGAGAILTVAVASSGRPRAAWALLPLGGAVVLVALAVDMPAGLDEGAAAVTYQGAHAILLSGFWAELSAGAVIALCGLLLPGYLRQGEAAASSPRARRRARRRAPRVGRGAGSGVQGARP